MKIIPLLILTILSMGCHYTWVESPPPPVGQTTSGWNQDHTVHYTCEQQDVNKALVWVACDFHNVSAQRTNTCLKVIYSKGSQEVAASRQVCSYYLWENQSASNYAAFTKDLRNQLAYSCGDKLQLCTLSTRLTGENK
jgi:hypothetical protein